MAARKPVLAGVAALVALLVLPTLADAANRRIAISNYQWSDRQVAIDRGEHVNWYWIGPDTMHSITGTSPNALGMDSDPSTNFPDHRVGDSFELSFDEPGTYEFHCKLHSTVRGTVTVSDQPGDPNTEPDPVPEPAVDLKPPDVRNVMLVKTRFGRKGTSLRYDLNERARLVADYYRLRPRRKPKFAGYAGWKAGHIGHNSVRFATRRKKFKAKPGRYLAKVTATDSFANTTRPFKLRFRIWKRR